MILKLLPPTIDPRILICCSNSELICFEKVNRHVTVSFFSVSLPPFDVPNGSYVCRFGLVIPQLRFMYHMHASEHSSLT